MLMHCTCPKDAALDAISTAFHDLEALDLSYCNISTTCLLSPTLCNLYIYGCANLKEEFFAKVTELFSLLFLQKAVFFFNLFPTVERWLPAAYHDRSAQLPDSQ